MEELELSLREESRHRIEEMETSLYELLQKHREEAEEHSSTLNDALVYLIKL